MRLQTFYFIAGLIFTAAGTMHILRAVLNWTIIINGWTLPMWVSWVVGVIVILLAIKAWALGIRTKRER